MSDGRIAVDVVFLPEPSMVDRALEVNRGLVDRSGSEIVLDARTCLPHVSLAMGCMAPQDVEAVGRVLAELAAECPIRALTLIGTAIVTNSRGLKVSSWLIAKTEPLQRLHEQAMHRLDPFFTYDATEAMLLGQGPVAATTLDWIRDFPRKSSLAFFWPHITLGYGEAPGIDRPFSFAVAALAICHLGNHCTCRKVLTSVQFQNLNAAP